MYFLVNFKLYPEIRKTPIRTGYRPDWVSVSDEKPDYNCAVLWLPNDVLEVAW